MFNSLFNLSVMFQAGSILLYLGPETIMPLASILAAIVGLLLIFWRYIVGIIKRIFRAITGKKEQTVDMDLDPDVVISESVSADSSQQND